MRLTEREKYIATVARRSALREFEAQKRQTLQQIRFMIGITLPIIAFVISAFWLFRSEIIHFLVKDPFKERVAYYVDVADNHRKQNSDKFLADLFDQAANSADGFALKSLEINHVPNIKSRADEIDESVPQRVWETLADGDENQVRSLVSNKNFMRELFDQRKDAWKIFDVRTPPETLRQEIVRVGSNNYQAKLVMLEAERDGNGENCGGNFNQNEFLVILQDHGVKDEGSPFQWARCDKFGWPTIYLNIRTPNITGERDYIEARLVGVRPLDDGVRGPRLVVTTALASKVGFSESQIIGRNGNMQASFTLSRLD